MVSQPNLIKIGATGDVQELSSFGRKLFERWEDGLIREDRASDGTLRKDIISRKKQFSLSYEIADQSTVDRIETLFQINAPLTLELTHLTTTTTYTVLMGVFEKERLLAVYNGLWAGLSVELREV